MSEYAFDADIAVTRRDDHTFDGHLHSRWTIAGVPNGGYVMAAMIRAAQEMTDHPDPLTMTAHFLSPTAAGPVELRTEVVKPGRSTSAVAVALIQDGRERVRALLTLGNMDERAGPSHSFTPMPVLAGPFVSERSPVMQEFPQNFEFEVPRSVAGGVLGQPTGDPETGGRISFADGRPHDLLSLPVVADGFAPVAFNLGHPAWTPTLELTIHFWNHPAPGPITAWIRSAIVQDGYHDESADLWDSTGTLVARSRQLALILGDR